MSEEKKQRILRAEAHAWAIKSSLAALSEEIVMLDLDPPYNTLANQTTAAEVTVENIRDGLEDASEEE